ncbi:pteridine reductase [Sorangium cellulosum]|uniref:Pteridine reductase n=2 Tax=Polyangiaceae TaxID=49 RepID=A0A4P2QQR7_SORCE|nr:pteridine reductase [Sorangium cellulosum]WCQ91720.1 3-oxoacyl-[acyl-carrier-protein] reductase FabG [Sorangium sp. Soce836]
MGIGDSVPQRTGKVALITGAARRVGAVIARVLHAEGFNIAVHYHSSRSEAEQLVGELNSARGGSASLICAKLDDRSSISSVVSSTVRDWGRLDVLVNNASTYYPTRVETATEREWDDLVDVNLKVPFFMAQAALPWLRESRGCIVNLVDVNAKRPLKGYPIYCAAKAGLVSLTEALALELAPEIRVNGVAPGTVMWPEKQNALNEVEQRMALAKIPLGRIGSCADVADAVRYLVLADYVTGHIVTVDGGVLLT